MSLKKRLEKLEQGAAGPEELLVFTQDFDDPELFTDEDGAEYRRGVNWPDDDNLTLILVVWDKNWRDEDEALY